MEVDEGPAADLPAGEFSVWLGAMQGVLRGEGSSDVPCDGCTACCRSSQFIHIAPDETETLAQIPSTLLFPAPRLPAGHMLLGYDGDGCCPMLVGDQCSIYQYRPRTCRNYDCRVFPAAAVEIEDDKKAPIVEQVRRWRFAFPSEEDRREHLAVRSAAEFLRHHGPVLPMGATPTDPTQLAVLAVDIADVFLGTGSRSGEVVDPGIDAVRVALVARRPMSPGREPRAGG